LNLLLGYRVHLLRSVEAMTEEPTPQIVSSVFSPKEIELVTSARLFLGRAGTAYRTKTQLQLRADHAAARDALSVEISLEEGPLVGLVEDFGLFEVSTCARSLPEHLAHPELGRQLSEDAKTVIATNCASGVDVQIVVGDGLSPRAILAQVPQILPDLMHAFRAKGRTVGRPFFLRRCRVGVMNGIGELLDPEVVILLVGERSGLATAESVSAYMAYRPRPRDTDANRNLVSNIHSSGMPTATAVARIVEMEDLFRLLGRSGATVRGTSGVQEIASIRDE